MYGNSAISGPNGYGSTFNHSCTTPAPGGTGNITDDPHFVNAAAGDYHLNVGSPCIDAGTNLDWMAGATDLDGNSRIVSGTVDIGAYEWQLQPVIITSSPLPSGAVGVAYSQTLTAGGGATPYTWAIYSGSLPPGLNLSTNGVISGTPSVATNASFTVQVIDSNVLSSTKFFSLAISVMITLGFDGTHVQLSWPAGYLGWELQAQSNLPGAGLGTNWFPVPGSTTTTQMSIPIDRANESVFYRLHQQ